MGDQEVGDGSVAEGCVGVMVVVGGPVEEVKGMVGNVLVLDNVDNQVWGVVR